MASKGTLTVKIVGDASNFTKTMDGIQGRLSTVGAGIAKVGKTVAIGTAAAGAGAVALGQEVLNMGAKLTAWRQKTATVFEGQADDVRKWADANNEAFGLTDDELAGLAASFGDLLKPMGFTAEQAAAMSKDVVGLSGALSEWSGGQRSAAEVSAILSKAMLGEREGLKELGISITEAEVSTRLLEKGQEKLTGAALQQAKALATQELIFEKSTDAQKAYAEGGNEALQASNRIKAGLAELREQIADRLLPIALRLGEWIGEQIPKAVAKAQPAVARIVEAFKTFAGFITSSVIPTLRRITKWATDNEAILIGVAVAVGVGLVAAFTAWAVAAAAAAAATLAAIAPVVAIGAAIAALVAGIVWAYQNWDTFRNTVDTVASFLSRTVWPVIQDGARILTDVVVPAIRRVIEFFWNFAAAVFAVVVQVVSRLDDIVRFMIGLPGKIADAASRAFDGLKDAAKAAVRFVLDQLDRLLGPLDEIGGKVGGIVSKVGGVIGKLPSFDSGGIVPGPIGSEQLILAHGGETVLPTHKQRMTTSGRGDLTQQLLWAIEGLTRAYQSSAVHMDGRYVGRVNRRADEFWVRRNAA